jgi:hypothetical protein
MNCVWTGPRRAACVALFAALALLATASAGRAEFLTNYDGNTQTTNGSGLDGTLNFAVLDQTTGGEKGNEWGAVVNPAATDPAHRYDPSFDKRFIQGSGSSALDTAARYLYLFQIVNNGTGTDGIVSFALSIDPSLVTSFGYFGKPGHGGIGGNDNMGAVGMDNNLGQDGSHFNGKADVGVSRPAIVSISDGSSVAPQDVTVSVKNGQLVVSFPANGLAQGDRSVLVGFTSNYAAAFNTASDQYRTFSFNGTSGQTFGQAPIPMPEPSAYVLMGVGVGCVGLLLWRRRKAATASPVAA